MSVLSVLVVGATGSVGGDITLKLARSGAGVSALVRGGEAHTKAKDLLAAGVGIVEGDLTRPETLAAAMDGIETVICTATSMPTGADDGLRAVDHEGTLALIKAAERGGVRRFVYVSYSGNIREASPLETAKRECEDCLLNGNMEAVVLRPSYFMEMWLSPALGFDPPNGTARIYGSGEAKVSYISALNVADFAVAAVSRKYSDRKTIVEMGGPEALSQLEALQIFDEVLKKTTTTEFVPQQGLEAQHTSPDPVQKTFGALMLAYAKGDVVKDAVAAAREHGVTLKSVKTYAGGLAGAASSAA